LHIGLIFLPIPGKKVPNREKIQAKREKIEAQQTQFSPFFEAVSPKSGETSPDLRQFARSEHQYGFSLVRNSISEQKIGSYYWLNSY